MDIIKKKSFVLLFILLNCFLYGLEEGSHGEYLTTTPYAKEFEAPLRQLIAQFGTQMQQEFGLSSAGYKRIEGNHLTNVDLEFGTYRKATIAEARALQVAVIDKFVQVINQDENIRPFLADYPFSHKNVKLLLNFKDPLDNIMDGTLTHVSHTSNFIPYEANRGKIFYSTYNAFTNQYSRPLVETYEEAVHILATSPVENLTVHQATPQEVLMNQLLGEFKENIDVEYRLVCSSIGCQLKDQIEEIGGFFQVRRCATEKQARQLIVEVTEKLLVAFNQNEKIRPYLAEYPFPAHRLKIVIDFVDNQYCWYDNGTLQDVILMNGQLEYHQQVQKEDSWLHEEVLIKKESYEEALKETQSSPVSLYKFKPKSFLGKMWYGFYSLFSD